MSPEPLSIEHTHSQAHLRGLDGWDDISSIQPQWDVHYMWGADGWDIGEMPYTSYATRTLDDGTAQVRSYCEGDVTITTFASFAEATASLDEAFLFYARRRRWWDEDEYRSNPARFQGPFSWDRLNLEPT